VTCERWGFGALVVCLGLLSACTAREGEHCRHGVTCDGARALVCIDHKWVAQRCQPACTTGKRGAQCELVDDPRPGESCWFPSVDEGYTSSLRQTQCARDHKSVLSCRPPNGVWASTPCGDGMECDRGHCRAAPAPPPPQRILGQPYFVNGVEGAQAKICEAGSPPLPLEKNAARPACWYEGAACGEHGTVISSPFKLTGNVVAGMSVHGGCDLGTYALLYERNSSPLRVRVCEQRPAPMDCPAMVQDGARWDLTPLLIANHQTKAKLLTR
jgi:hypothetical protein